MLKFYVEVFCVMGEALSGELSCLCDRSRYLYGTIVSKINFKTALRVKRERGLSGSTHKFI